MGNFKVYATFNKSLGQTAPYAILSMPCSSLNKADNFTYYSKSDAHHSHNNFQLDR